MSEDRQIMCGDCDALIGVLEGEAPPKGLRCRRCGSDKLTVLITVEDEGEAHEQLDLAVRSGGGGKPVRKVRSGDSYSHDRQKWVELHRDVNRLEDRYHEIVRDLETGEVLHECEEPLSEHQGHGSAKERTPKPRAR